jgi:xanthine dehydrogenase accessory factor
MQHWIEKLHELLDAGVRQSVLVTIAKVQGSAPREAGARMIVTDNQVFGTIGGGNLEFTAIDQARTMALDSNSGAATTRQFALGPSLGQCCGGRVILSFETITDADAHWIDEVRTCLETNNPCVVVTGFDPGKVKALKYSGSTKFPQWVTPELSRLAAEVLDDESSIVYLEQPVGASEAVGYTLDAVKDCSEELWLFGAGHVGRAIVEVLEDLPYRIRWVDSRAQEFAERLPSNVSVVLSDEPQYEVASAQAGAIFLVMSHNHQLDEDICRAVLEREDFGFLGLIGSASKKARFLHRLRERGISESLLRRMVCPIGIDAIKGKKPREIAISVAAQLLSLAGEESVQIAESVVDAVSR